MSENYPAPKVWLGFIFWRLTFYRWGWFFERTELPVLGIGVE